MPDAAGLWRYAATTLLLAAMLLSSIYNGVLALRRYQRNRTRIEEIQQLLNLFDTGAVTLIAAQRQHAIVDAG